MTIAYYISGHGYGHVTRSLEIINYILCHTNHIIYIVSAIDKEFIIRNLSTNYDIPLDRIDNFIRFNKRVLDSGAIQEDALNVSPIDTLNSYYKNIHCNRKALLEFEIQWLKDNHIKIVLVDATPIAVRAASMNNCRVYILSNFSWDYIYSKLLESLDKDCYLYDDYKQMIELTSEDYSCCNLFIQYPGICPVAKCIQPEKVVCGPLIARSSKKTRIDIRRDYNIIQKNVLLLSFGGGHKFDFSNLKNSFLPDEWVCLVLGSQSDDVLPSERYIAIPSDCYVPDLLIMADCVIGKIGYGFVSECLAACCPLIYVSRNNWGEEQFLVHLLCQVYNAGIQMPYSDFMSGNWSNYILSSLSCKWELQDNHNPLTAPKTVFNLIESNSI